MSRDNIMSNPFENNLIVESLFKYLDFSQSLSLRLVSGTWNRAFLTSLRSKRGSVFHLSNLQCNEKDTSSSSYASDISEFISTHRLKGSGLHLSLVAPRPWMHTVWRTQDWLPKEKFVGSDETKFPTLHDELISFYETAVNEPFVASQVTSILLPRVGPLLTKVTLELVLKEEGDVGLTNALLAQIPWVTRLALDLYTKKDDLIQGLGPSGSLLLPALKSFSPRISFLTDNMPCGQAAHVLSEAAWTHLLSLFPSTRYLDLEGPETSESFIRFMDNSCETTIRALQGLHELGRLPFLIGLRMPRSVIRYSPSLPASLKRLTLPLRELYLRNSEHGRDEGGALDCLANFSGSLETLDVHVQRWGKGWSCSRSSLSHHHLPRLSSFTVSCQNPWGAEVKSHDAFGLASLFQSDPSVLMTLLPALSSITLFYTPLLGGWDRLWKVLFPEGRGEEGYTYPQIQKLSLSLVAECEAPIMSRIFQTFPFLTVLRHMRNCSHHPHRPDPEDEDETEEGDWFHMCAHSWALGDHSSSLVEKEGGATCSKQRVWDAWTQAQEGETHDTTTPLAANDAWIFDEDMTPSHLHYFWSGPSLRACRQRLSQN